MKINFIVPTLNLTGGIRVVSIYAKLLQERGHDVTVISPGRPKPSYLKRIKSYLKGKGWSAGAHYSSAFFDPLNVNLQVLDQHRAVEERDVPDADVVIATFWNSAEWIANFAPAKGKKFYFVQHHEVHPWMPIERVKATLRLPYKKIVVAQWLADVLKAEYGDDDAIVVSNGVDHKQFFSGNRSKNAVPVFGMMYSNRSFKGCDLAIACIEKARLRYPSIKLIAFGTERLNAEQLPTNTEYLVRPEQDKIREIYSLCDAWLFTSRTEGFGLPILESMACKTPVIGTRCGAAPELLQTGGGILVDVDDAEALVNAIYEICELPDKQWHAMSASAYQESLLHGWNDKADAFEQALTT